MKIHLVVSFLAILCLINISCKKSRPQLPSNKAEYVKSEIEMDKVNKLLVEKEDSVLLAYITSQEVGFEKDDAGFYYKVTKHSSGNFLKKDDICTISYKIYLLDGTFAEEVNDLEVVVGKHETLKGIDLGLILLRKGENAVFVFPWTLGYGMLGNRTTIPAYTSLKVELFVADDESYQ